MTRHEPLLAAAQQLAASVSDAQGRYQEAIDLLQETQGLVEVLKADLARANAALDAYAKAKAPPPLVSTASLDYRDVKRLHSDLETLDHEHRS